MGYNRLSLFILLGGISPVKIIDFVGKENISFDAELVKMLITLSLHATIRSHLKF